MAAARQCRVRIGTVMLVNGWNNVVDNNSGTTVGFSGAWTPGSHFTRGNYDYGVDKFAAGDGKARWTGVATNIRVAPNAWMALVPRFEWYNDADGFTTGVAQKLKEGTLTAEFKVRAGLVSRMEYRRDWSDQRFFDRGGAPASMKFQDTLLGFVLRLRPSDRGSLPRLPVAGGPSWAKSVEEV